MLDLELDTLREFLGGTTGIGEVAITVSVIVRKCCKSRKIESSGSSFA